MLLELCCRDNILHQFSMLSVVLGGVFVIAVVRCVVVVVVVVVGVVLVCR